MHIEMRETRIQPHSMVTLCPSVSVMYMVVDRPKGTAMIANDSPSTLNMLRLLGNSDL